MFTRSAKLYDTIYSFKNYAEEASRIRKIVLGHLPEFDAQLLLLDVACGTGKHLEHLREHFQVEGLDLEPELIEIARNRLPGIAFQTADMTCFDLEKRFDVVTCLFSSIGYVGTVDRLNAAIQCMANHVRPGGVLILEPWFTPESWKDNMPPGSQTSKDGETEVTRFYTFSREGNVSISDFEYRIVNPSEESTFSEHHRLTLFSHAEYLNAFSQAGLQVHHDPTGLIGRGMYVGLTS